jgi:hypothetical protein
MADVGANSRWWRKSLGIDQEKLDRAVAVLGARSAAEAIENP